MALTKEILIKQEGLELTEDQITAITGLSSKDESIVLANEKKTIEKDYLAKVKEASGLDTSPDGKNFSSYLAESFKVLSADTKEIEGLKTKLKEQEKLIKEGKGAEQLKKDLADKEAEIAKWKEKTTGLENSLTKIKADGERTLLSLKADSQLNQALVNFKFSPGIDDAMRKSLVEAAKLKIGNSFKMEEVQGSLVFRDEKEEIIRNADLTPKTYADLLKENLASVLVKPQAGAGSTPPGGNGNGANLMDFSEVKNRVQANELIAKKLAAEGLVRDGTVVASKKYNEAFDKIYKENKVAELPLH